ncbi:MAG: TetR/AcrR family transcriptional regulator [Prevotella sp.]|jgi:AcrR family transcriptional regulator|nr:TetR/AcrR family transcriptional regulator [Prevotella sp.]
MNYNKISKRKKRRNVQEIEKAVFLATEKLVGEKGFSNVAFTEIMRLAEVEPQVMYRRFNGIEDLYDKFIRNYDYWLHDIVEYHLDEKNPVVSMRNILTELADSLYENPIMQKILVWEVSDHNKLTCRAASNRETNSLPLLDFFRANLPQNIDFDCFTSILIAGIYYLIIRRERSLFCGIDFDKDEGKALLIETIIRLIDIVYTQKTDNNEAVEIAQRLLEQGVNEEIVSISTKLSKQVIMLLKKNV